MANEKNLDPVKSKSEARKRGSAGGVASGKSRREKKAMRETLDILLSMPMKDDAAADVESIQSFAAIKGRNISVREAILIAQVQKAMKGDTRAFEMIRDTIGEKPVENINVNAPDPGIMEEIRRRMAGGAG